MPVTAIPPTTATELVGVLCQEHHWPRARILWPTAVHIRPMHTEDVEGRRFAHLIILWRPGGDATAIRTGTTWLTNALAYHREPQCRVYDLVGG